MRYIERVPERESPKGTGHLAFGNYIHRVFELGYKLTTFSELKELAEKELKNYDVPEKYLKYTDTCLKNFLILNSSLTETIAVEYKYSYQLEADASGVGIIDRIVRGMTGKYLIIDYKTGKPKQQHELYNDYQLQDYTLAVHKEFNVPIPDITAALYYPKIDKLISINYTSQQILGNHLNESKKSLWEIRKKKKDDFKPVQNPLCDWCGYRDYCPKFNTNWESELAKTKQDLKSQKEESHKQ